MPEDMQQSARRDAAPACPRLRALRTPLLVMHSPTDELVGVGNYLTAKYNSALYHRYDEGTAGEVVPGGQDTVLDYTVQTNDGAAWAKLVPGNRPVYSTDVPSPIVPLTRMRSPGDRPAVGSTRSAQPTPARRTRSPVAGSTRKTPRKS